MKYLSSPDDVIYRDIKSLNLTREAWKQFIGWNVYMNYDVKAPNVVIVMYNYYVACECRRLKRPIYLPFRYKDAQFKIEIDRYG